MEAGVLDLTESKYTSKEVAAALGISPSTLRGYTRRRSAQEFGPFHRDDQTRLPAAKGGQPDLYNLRGVIQLAAVIELLRAGYAVAAAFEIAAVLFGTERGKQSGGCYHRDYGDTFLIACREHKHPLSSAQHANPAVWLLTQSEIGDFLHQATDGAGSTLIINVTFLELRVFKKLRVQGNSWDGTEQC